MASHISTPNLSTILFISSLVFISTSTTFVSCYGYQFHLGWSKPTGNETESLDEWAERNRFHVGDTIYFKYQNDSVMVVDRDDYKNCDVSNPISAFSDGKTVFKFDRFGFFYFISGQPGHCRSGQRVIIRVMVHPEVVGQAPNIAPSPQGGSGGGGGGGGGGDWGGQVVTPNSTVRLPVASYFMTALGGMMVMLYLFM